MTLNDRFEKNVQDHKDAVKSNVSASGNIEVRGERKQLLDDIILSVEKIEELQRAEKNECTELDRQLQEAREIIHNRVVSRGSSAGQKSRVASTDDALENITPSK